jgi:hypothetical protein
VCSLVAVFIAAINPFTVAHMQLVVIIAVTEIHIVSLSLIAPCRRKEDLLRDPESTVVVLFGCLMTLSSFNQSH